MSTSWRDRCFVLSQYLMPNQAMTALGGVVAGARGGAVTQAIIRRFVKRFGVNMAEAAQVEIGAYATFNEFFTRALAAGVRPIARADLVCPVDGAISAFGAIERDRIFQAKGHRYSSAALLGGDAALAGQFEDGHFATLYLSPKDYHRIHMPCAGRLLRMLHVPGALFSVNPATAQAVPGLFARNERVVCIFETKFGLLALVLVGATIVGSMATAWQGVVNPPRSSALREWRYADREIHLAQGEEMGRFLLGSTVVMLWPKLPLRFNSQWHPGGAVRLGQAMAQLD